MNSRGITTSVVLSDQQSTVLKNTYLLLSLTIAFSALMAYVGVMIGAQPNFLLFLVAVYGSLFAVHSTANSGLGILFSFVFTGSLGYFSAPMLSMILTLSNGGAIISMALGTTALITFALSMYVLITRKDFSFMGGVLFVGVLVAFITSLVAMLGGFPMLSVVSSGLFALVSSGMILFHTSNIIHGGERNYILAATSLFVAIYNLFISLLHILSLFGGSRD